MRFLYTLLVSLAAPLALALLLWRGLFDRSYRERIGERLGRTRIKLDRPSLWIHAVSVGEVRAAAILIPHLKAAYASLDFVVTTATPTGASQVRELFGDTVLHCYLPYDLPGAVRRFLDRVRPRLGIVMETEIWPNLYLECGRRGIPLVIASARLSARSVARYRRMSGLLSQVFAQDVTIAAQSAGDAGRFRSIGADPGHTHVTGNLKFDLAIAESTREEGRMLRQSMAAARFVWVAGSTREHEEVVVLDAHLQVRRMHPDALLILVPRHPQRFGEVRTLLGKRGVPHVTRSSQAPVTVDTAVLLVDTLGELQGFYAAADLAFVGGSLVPAGGHNLLEPAAIGIPVLTGPHAFNAPDVARLLFESGAASEVHSASELADAVCTLFENSGDRKRRGDAGLAVVESNRGAVERVMKLVKDAGTEGRRDVMT